MKKLNLFYFIISLVLIGILFVSCGRSDTMFTNENIPSNTHSDSISPSDEIETFTNELPQETDTVSDIVSTTSSQLPTTDKPWSVRVVFKEIKIKVGEICGISFLLSPRESIEGKLTLNSFINDNSIVAFTDFEHYMDGQEYSGASREIGGSTFYIVGKSVGTTVVTIEGTSKYGITSDTCTVIVSE